MYHWWSGSFLPKTTLGVMTQSSTIITTSSSFDNTFRISFGDTTFTVPMASDSLYYITKNQVKQLLTQVIFLLFNFSTTFTRDQLARPDRVRRLHCAFLHPSYDVPIKALKYSMVIGTRLQLQDVYLYLYRLVFAAGLCYLDGKTISPSYKESLCPDTHDASIVLIDLIPLSKIIITIIGCQPKVGVPYPDLGYINIWFGLFLNQKNVF